MTEHPNLASALVAALADLSVVEKGRTANVGSYKYDYAAIEDVVKLTRPALANHGVVALTPVHDHGTGLACTVTLLHTSGDRLDLGPFPFPHGKDAQATGSMVTYHRRYALVAALGMAAGDDDDGAAAAPRPANHAATEPAASGFLGTFNELAPEAKNKVLGWLRDRGHRPSSVPDELVAEVTEFIGSLTVTSPEVPAEGGTQVEGAETSGNLPPQAGSVSPAASAAPSVRDKPALGAVKQGAAK